MSWAIYQKCQWANRSIEGNDPLGIQHITLSPHMRTVWSLAKVPSYLQSIILVLFRRLLIQDSAKTLLVLGWKWEWMIVCYKVLRQNHQCFILSFLISLQRSQAYFLPKLSHYCFKYYIYFFFSNNSYYIFSMFEISLQEETWQYLAYIFSILTVCSRTQCSPYIKQIHIR